LAEYLTGKIPRSLLRGTLQSENRMKTNHKIIFSNSKKMDDVPSESVDLIVTSPPYPMIQMWDEMFCKQNPSIETALKKAE